MLWFGKGIDRVFGIVGALLALLGCLIGNLLSVCCFVSVAEKMEFFEVVSRLNPRIVLQMIKGTFSPIGLLFYGIAIYLGYRLSFRRYSDQELMRAIKGGGSQDECA